MSDETIVRAYRWRTNAEMLQAAQQLGHVSGWVLDATYGLGIWWRKLVADGVGMDHDPIKVLPAPRGVQADFRQPPFRSDAFDTILYDPDYKLSGTPTTAASKWVKREGDALVDERYGVSKKGWQQRIGDMLDGLAWWPACCWCEGLGRVDGTPENAMEIMVLLAGIHPDASCSCPGCQGSGRGEMRGLAPLLKPGGKLLVKCMDQVVGGTVRPQRHLVMTRAEEAGLVFVDELDRLFTPRWQNPKRQQLNAQANYSSLLVFKDRRPRRS